MQRSASTTQTRHSNNSYDLITSQLIEFIFAILFHYYRYYYFYFYVIIFAIHFSRWPYILFFVGIVFSVSLFKLCSISSRFDIERRTQKLQWTTVYALRVLWKHIFFYSFFLTIKSQFNNHWINKENQQQQHHQMNDDEEYSEQITTAITIINKWNNTFL